MMHHRMHRKTCLVTAMEIKPREVAFSAAIVFVMLGLGFLIGGKISDHTAEENERYMTATQITNDEQFRYALETDFGNVIAYGELVAEQPVSADDLDGTYAQIIKTTEEYTRHTRVVTTTDSNGHTHSRTEVYWTWDEIDRERKSTESFSFMGVSFPENKFVTESHFQGEYIYDSINFRHYYEVTDAELTGSIHTQVKEHTIADENRFWDGMDPQAVVDHAVKHANVPIAGFWVLWLALIGGAVYGFCTLENRWLDG